MKNITNGHLGQTYWFMSFSHNLLNITIYPSAHDLVTYSDAHKLQSTCCHALKVTLLKKMGFIRAL